MLTFIRKGKNPKDFLVIICNFTPVERQKVKVGVPFEGLYEELLNTELSKYGGSWDFSQESYESNEETVNGKEFSLEVISPPLSVLILKPKKIKIKGAKS